MRSANCQETLVALSIWSPDSADLPDNIALHLDACPRCTQAFAQRFPPWEAALFDAPCAHGPVRLPTATRWHRLLGGAAVAAAGVLLVSRTLPLPLPPSSSPMPSSVEPVALLWPAESLLTTEELLLVPECPLHALDDLEWVCPPEDDAEWL